MEVEPGISFLLDPRDLVSSALLSTKQWQPEIWNAISPALNEGSVFLDVGAHIGYFSMKASRKAGRTGRVLAFEPNPETLVLLRDNVRVNRAWPGETLTRYLRRTPRIARSAPRFTTKVMRNSSVPVRKSTR